MPLLDNMSHELTELYFPLPAAPSATFTSVWIGNETRFQEVSPLFPKRALGEAAVEKAHYSKTFLFVLLSTMALVSVLGPQPTFSEHFDWHSRGYFGEYRGSRRFLV